MDKFCSSCGQKITEEGTFCINCGCNLNQQVQNTNATQTNNYNENSNQVMGNPNYNVNTGTAPSYTNGLAITGFVLGVVSLLCCCYTSFIGIIGLIFSIIGLKNSQQNGNIGKGLSVAGIILNSISIFFFVGFIILLVISIMA